MTTFNDIILAAVYAIPPTLAAVAAVIASMRNGRKVDQVAVRVNGRLDQLLEASTGKAQVEGEIRGMLTARTEAIRALELADAVRVALSRSDGRPIPPELAATAAALVLSTATETALKLQPTGPAAAPEGDSHPPRTPAA